MRGMILTTLAVLRPTRLTVSHIDISVLTLCTLQAFLQELLDQQFSVLHPLSSFQRRSFSLSILQLMAACFRSPLALTHGSSAQDGPGIPAVFVFSSVVSELQGACLVKGLRDPYDTNRALCLELLLELPVHKLGLTVSESARCLNSKKLFCRVFLTERCDEELYC